MNGHPALWEVLLDPPGADFLPSARSDSWRTRIDSLHSYLRSVGQTTRFRTPTSLWTLLRGTPLPTGATCSLLIGTSSLQDLIDATRRHQDSSGPSFVSWNVRWMVDPHTTQNNAKRLRIRRWLDAGKIVMLQETHWSAADSAIWANPFHAATTLASTSGGPGGGVAIIIPPGVSITGRREVVPGYAITADLNSGGQPFRSWYLPPGARNDVLDQVGQALPTQGPPLFTRGDLNFHIPDPSPDEMDRARKVFSLLSERSSSCLGCGGPTHNPATGSRGRPRQLDAVSVPSKAMKYPSYLDQRRIRPCGAHYLCDPPTRAKRGDRLPFSIEGPSSGGLE